jgi:hypothetical protein
MEKFKKLTRVEMRTIYGGLVACNCKNECSTDDDCPGNSDCSQSVTCLSDTGCKYQICSGKI